MPRTAHLTIVVALAALAGVGSPSVQRANASRPAAPPAGRSVEPPGPPGGLRGITVTAGQPRVQTYCVACQSAVGAMGSGGCKLACGILPMPASAICEWVQGFVSMCADIAAWLKQGLSPEEICKHLGYCGTECQCGVCSALSYPPPRLGVYLSQADPSDPRTHFFAQPQPRRGRPAGVWASQTTAATPTAPSHAPSAPSTRR